MSDFSDFCGQIADWANRQDWTPSLVTSFVRMAESKFNAELRVDRMIEQDQGLIASCCAPLPDDWLEMDFVQIANACAPTGFSPIVYMPRDQFFRLPNTNASSYYYPDVWNTSTQGYYTIRGRQIYFGGPPDTVNGIMFLIDYYQEVPVFADVTPSWIYTKYPSLYLSAALMHADLHAVGEEDKAAQQKQLAEDGIAKLNANHQRARASGSRLKRTRRRSFG